MEENRQRSKDYNNAKIYCIRNFNDNLVYVGSTTQPLSKRFNSHKNNIRSAMYSKHRLYQKMKDEGVDNFYIELYEDFPCENVEHLRKREGEVIREIGTLNKQIAGRTQNEYRNDNKDYVNERRKEYNKLQKEHVADLQKKNYYENHQAILEIKKRWRDKQPIVECDICGCMIKRSGLCAHQRTNKCKQSKVEEEPKPSFAKLYTIMH